MARGMSYRDSIEEDVFQQLRTNVRTLRLAAGLTLKKAAERAEMHWRHWQKIEAGEINITLHTLIRLAKVLGVDVAALLGDRQRLMN
jgi:transcriptional regulator with XRE-family HTH domain